MQCKYARIFLDCLLVSTSTVKVVGRLIISVDGLPSEHGPEAAHVLVDCDQWDKTKLEGLPEWGPGA